MDVKSLENEDEKFQIFSGVGYEALDHEMSKDIEDAYQLFKKTKTDQIAFVNSGEDVFQVCFKEELNGHYEILNTTTEFSRQLARRQKIKGPFRETKTYQWRAPDEEKLEIPKQI